MLSALAAAKNLKKKKTTTDLIPLATAWLRGRLVAVLQVTPTQLLCNACCYF